MVDLKVDLKAVMTAQKMAESLVVSSVEEMAGLLAAKKVGTTVD